MKIYEILMDIIHQIIVLNVFIIFFMYYNLFFIYSIKNVDFIYLIYIIFLKIYHVGLMLEIKIYNYLHYKNYSYLKIIQFTILNHH